MCNDNKTENTHETVEEKHEKKLPLEQNEKLFTQEEVNKIIQKRLYDCKKEQARVEYNEKEFQKREQALAEREDALNKREELYNRTEFLKRNNYPESFLDLITVEEGENFEDKVEKIVSAVDRTRFKRQSFDYIPGDDGIPGTFPELGQKHEPRYSKIR